MGDRFLNVTPQEFRHHLLPVEPELCPLPAAQLLTLALRQPLGGVRPWGRPDPRRIAKEIRGILYTLNRIQFVGSFEADGDDDFMIDAKSSREASMEFHRFDSFWNASAGECSLWLNGGRAVLSEGYK
ncbi:hypothetical protein NMY22_g15282 [Coprinellus aureogranulatus]|nr:hypothetical protein NMY22_g15282 [Coprinellus aureogranulatus]